ncbi:MAG TPA: hypothetical protein PLI62_12840, partial [Spirochaetota bacterium]|nr:hypothetical protein [Spirochaetota bacterium]
FKKSIAASRRRRQLTCVIRVLLLSDDSIQYFLQRVTVQRMEGNGEPRQEEDYQEGYADIYAALSQSPDLRGRSCAFFNFPHAMVNTA